MAGIKLLNIGKTYRNKIILKDFNVLINEGEFVMFSGESGSGKSTLLNIIGGIEEPDMGILIIDNNNISSMSKNAKRKFFQKNVSFIFRGFYLEPMLTIEENICLPGVFAGMPSRKRKDRAEVLIKILGLGGLQKKLPAEISGAQIARACIARALFLEPKFLLIDDPTRDLDNKNAENIIKILKLFQEKTHLTTIVATHDTSVAPYATKIINLGAQK